MRVEGLKGLTVLVGAQVLLGIRLAVSPLVQEVVLLVH